MGAYIQGGIQAAHGAGPNVARYHVAKRAGYRTGWREHAGACCAKVLPSAAQIVGCVSTTKVQAKPMQAHRGAFATAAGLRTAQTNGKRAALPRGTDERMPAMLNQYRVSAAKPRQPAAESGTATAKPQVKRRAGKAKQTTSRRPRHVGRHRGRASKFKSRAAVPKSIAAVPETLQAAHRS